MAGGAKKPTAVLKLEGGYADRPDRDKARAQEPAPEPGLGDPPKGMDAADVECWNELKEISPPGVLTKMDRPGAEFFCKLWAESRRTKLNKAQQQMLYALMNKFGLNPANRANLKTTANPVPTPAQTNKARFFPKKKGP